MREVSQNGDPLGTVVIAMVPLVQPPDDAPTPLAIDTDARKQAEEMLELVTRLQALESRTTHSIASPTPCVGLWCPDEKALAALDGRSVEVEVYAPSPQGVGRTGVLPRDGGRFELAQDRTDGVSLLTEALNAGSSLGQYGELMRLFERAFHCGPGTVEARLTAFLAGATHHGFEENEIHEWVSARGPAIHADRREEFLLDSDVRPFLGRMFEAGYDVLLNKSHWRSSSTERRDSWKPASGSAGRHSCIFVTQGADATLTAQLLDPFAAYPLVLAGPFDAVLPRAAWLMADQQKAVLAMHGQAVISIRDDVA